MCPIPFLNRVLIANTYHHPGIETSRLVIHANSCLKTCGGQEPLNYSGMDRYHRFVVTILSCSPCPSGLWESYPLYVTRVPFYLFVCM